MDLSISKTLSSPSWLICGLWNSFLFFNSQLFCFNLCLCLYSWIFWWLCAAYWALINLFCFPVAFFSPVKQSHYKNLSWMTINSGIIGTHTFFIIFGKEKTYFFVKDLHPSAATHYCLPKCTKLARKQMFPITNDIYQLVSE